MIADGKFVQLEVENREGERFRIGCFKSTEQFSKEELVEMERKAQGFVEEFGIWKRSPTKRWKKLFAKNGDVSEPMYCMDHGERFIDYDGNPVYISQPYYVEIIKGYPEEDIDGRLTKFANQYKMEYLRRDDLSYHCPGKTTLLIWRPMKRKSVKPRDSDGTREAQ